MLTKIINQTLATIGVLIIFSCAAMTSYSYFQLRKTNARIELLESVVSDLTNAVEGAQIISFKALAEAQKKQKGKR